MRYAAFDVAFPQFASIDDEEQRRRRDEKKKTTAIINIGTACILPHLDIRDTHYAMCVQRSQRDIEPWHIFSFLNQDIKSLYIMLL